MKTVGRRALMIFALASAMQSSGQDSSRIRNLVFEGAGIRGIAYCGAIEALENQGLLNHVERVGGTSAGAITALCLALGYTGAEIESIISSTDFKKFNDGRFLFPGGIHRTSRFYGWYRGRKFDRWLEKIIEQKTSNPHISFSQMHEKGLRDLYVTATDLTAQKLVVLSNENFPDMEVRDAVRMSMSIPLYFEALFMDSTGKVIRHPASKRNLSVMVDGGILGNFPIRLFDGARYMNESRDHHFVLNPETVGFRIDAVQQIRSDSAAGPLAPFPIHNFGTYVSAFYNIVIESLNRQQLKVEDWERTVSISDGGIAPRVRRMRRSEVDMLIQNGRMAVERYVQRLK